jgi:glycosyltransferase involved in cell wall biosynthesis
MKPKFLICSDTPVYKYEDYHYIFEPTYREISHFASDFSSITWITYKRTGYSAATVRVPKSAYWNWILLPNWRGGLSKLSKIKVLLSLPFQLIILLKEIIKADVVHLRAPSVPAMIVIFLLNWFRFSNKRFWIKYAGNWGEVNAAWAYAWQKKVLLKLQRSNVKITINGQWPGLHKGFISMENPCFSDQDYQSQRNLNRDKHEDSGPLHWCFVGHLEEFKGPLLLIEALQDPELVNSVGSLTLVGDGLLLKSLSSLAKTLPFPLTFTGYLPRHEIFEKVLRPSHVLVLPSNSEGFPKVIAEGMLYRCIPIVTKVSALEQFIHQGTNGYLFPDLNKEEIVRVLKLVIELKDRTDMADKAYETASLFTYERFHGRIIQEVL